MSHELDVFVVAPTGRDGPLICDMLEPRGVSCSPYRSVEELYREMSGGVGAIILTEEALVPGAMEKLNDAFTGQPKWSDIGLILLTGNSAHLQAAVRARLHEHGVRSIIVIERPVRLLTLVGTVESALQSRKRQYELRDYLEEKARNEERLRQTQKLESVGILAGGIAHDFNNLLTGVLGNASLALELVPPEDEVHSILNEVVRAAEGAAHLTRQLLAYAGKGRFLIEVLELSRQVREISSLMQTAIPRTVQLKLELADDLPPVQADAAQIQQVVMNLAINGAEAIPEGQPGTVWIRTRLQNVDETYVQRIVPGSEIAPGRYVTLEVRDTGCGMDERTLERIFDPFFTTKFTGRGLGLAAVLGIVKSHKGAVRVYSTPGKGTTFKLLFPATGEQARKPAATGPDAASLAGHGLILVIDDEETVRRTARLTLERFGYTVLVAENGRQGLDTFRGVADRVELVLLDMTMPVISGAQTFQELRTVRPDVKVILSSGYNEAETIRRFAGKGLAGFVQKPYTSTRLAQAVSSALR